MERIPLGEAVLVTPIDRLQQLSIDLWIENDVQVIGLNKEPNENRQ